jgi:hypothetical protein
VYVTGGSSTTKAIVNTWKTTLEVIASKDFDLVGSTIDCLVPVSNLFIGNEIEFEAHISFNQPLNWVNCGI